MRKHVVTIKRSGFARAVSLHSSKLDAETYCANLRFTRPRVVDIYTRFYINGFMFDPPVPLGMLGRR